jgi:hypothetical protein
MIPAVPVAERVVVEMISTELVPARKPVVSPDVALTEMSSTMVDAGKMTSADVTSPEVSTAMATATPVSTTMTASGVATAMTTTVTTTAMAAATVTTTLAEWSVGRQSQRPKRNGHRQNPRQFGFHGVLPLSATVGNVNPKTLKLQYHCERSVLATLPWLTLGGYLKGAHKVKSGGIEHAKARHQAGKVLAMVCGDWSGRQYGDLCRLTYGFVAWRTASRRPAAHRLDADHAWRHFLEKRHDLATLQLPTNNQVAFSINAMDLKDRLRDIETDCRNRLHV